MLEEDYTSSSEEEEEDKLETPAPTKKKVTDTKPYGSKEKPSSYKPRVPVERKSPEKPSQEVPETVKYGESKHSSHLKKMKFNEVVIEPLKKFIPTSSNMNAKYEYIRRITQGTEYERLIMAAAFAFFEQLRICYHSKKTHLSFLDALLKSDEFPVLQKAHADPSVALKKFTKELEKQLLFDLVKDSVGVKKSIGEFLLIAVLSNKDLEKRLESRMKKPSPLEFKKVAEALAAELLVLKEELMVTEATYKPLKKTLKEPFVFLLEEGGIGILYTKEQALKCGYKQNPIEEAKEDYERRYKEYIDLMENFIEKANRISKTKLKALKEMREELKTVSAHKWNELKQKANKEISEHLGALAKIEKGSNKEEEMKLYIMCSKCGNNVSGKGLYELSRGRSVCHMCFKEYFLSFKSIEWQKNGKNMEFCQSWVGIQHMKLRRSQMKVKKRRRRSHSRNQLLSPNENSKSSLMKFVLNAGKRMQPSWSVHTTYVSSVQQCNAFY
eukprot:TRINITY_DN71528_c0_g1_i1.p1 TRINITY_DN71528_c0_g1~~TRINITY_DN71528_c0_g1_i1.p1  ORF type:complete len:498 (-),score=68.39 TRINITY_DN71528_c0_g1_i1:243-1736(-)